MTTLGIIILIIAAPSLFAFGDELLDAIKGIPTVLAAIAIVAGLVLLAAIPPYLSGVVFAVSPALSVAIVLVFFIAAFIYLYWFKGIRLLNPKK